MAGSPYRDSLAYSEPGHNDRIGLSAATKRQDGRKSGEPGAIKKAVSRVLLTRSRESQSAAGVP
jgi:hypothetical protein